MIDKQEIFDKAHLKEGNNLAREYFKQCGLTYEDLNEDRMKRLKCFINAEIAPLLLDETYSMVKEYQVHNIKHNKWGWFLTVEASYFGDREGVSFYDLKNNDPKLPIGFCGKLIKQKASYTDDSEWLILEINNIVGNKLI